MSTELEKILAMRQRLNAVSPSFCLAKWLQVTAHLQNGHTHSCHHPVPHKISPEEIRSNPTALHNTEYKKLQRKAMLEGKRPAECDYCWKIEDAPGEHVSDRHIKSHDGWAAPHFDYVESQPWNADVNPTYMEVSFSSTCNFKCAYCAPHVSSKWMEEIRQHGAYPTSAPFNGLGWLQDTGKIPIPESQENPYVEAFWKWWPELYRSLKEFRITGGEPLLTPNTFRVLEHIDANPRPDLDLAINSNLGVPRKLIEKFADRVESITQGGKVKTFILYTSADTWGEQAAYIRYGMDFEQYWDNLNYLLGRLGRIQVTFMCTFNALSIPRFRSLLEGILALKREYRSKSRYHTASCFLDVSYLRFPDFLSAQILDESFHAPMERLIQFMNENSEERIGDCMGFFDFERVKMARLLDWMKSPIDPEWLRRNRKDFATYITEYDRRRGTDFVRTFPEMSDFYRLCKET